jgi:hypothetical protein
MTIVAVLFARRDSVYKTLPDVDVWDEDRDARGFLGGMPVIAHPPCSGWGRMRNFSYADEAMLRLAPFAIEQVQMNGGVLEHPAESSLFWCEQLPRPGRFPDKKGGYSITLDQFNFGHRAEKRTWLYIVGCEPDCLPPIPRKDGKPTHCVRPTKTYPRLPSITKPEREHTPIEFARWLVEVAKRCVR